jgi:YVTN family beta-propeller protein/VCBS repeat-containing protein
MAAGQSRATRRNGREPYAWLGAGALTLGVGAALAAGSGVAHADAAAPASSSSPRNHAEGAHPASLSERRTATTALVGSSRHAGRETTAVASVGASRLAAARSVVPRTSDVTAPVAEIRAVLATPAHPLPSAVTSGVSSVVASVAATETAAVTPAATVPLSSASPSASANPVVTLLARVLSLFGVTGPRAPANPLGALVWGFFRNIEVATGLAPRAGKPTVGAADPTTGEVSGTLGFTEPDGQPMTYSFATDPSQGVATVYFSDGSFVYTPTEAAREAATGATTDTFRVTATDGVASTTETVTVPVAPLGSPPTDKPVALSPQVGTPNPATGVVQGTVVFTDPQSQALSYTVTTNPTQGAVTVTGAGTFTYTPTPAARQNATVSTTDTFTVTASDGVASTPETVTVSVLPVGGTSVPAGPGTVTGVGTDPYGVAISPDGSRVYVLNGTGGTVSVINTATNSVIKSIPVPYTSYGATEEIAANPNGSAVYVANLSDDTVSVISTATNAVIKTVNVGYEPDAITVSADGSRAYVVNTGGGSQNGTVSVINTATNSVITTFTVAHQLDAVAVAGSKLYVTDVDGTTATSAVVTMINTATNTSVDITVPTYSGGLGSIAASPDGSSVYVVDQIDKSNGSYDAVSVINTATNAVSGPFLISATGVPAKEIGDMVVSPDGSHLYLTIEGGNANGTVVVFSTATDSQVGSLIAVGSYPGGLAISPDGSLAYVANSGTVGGGQSVSVIAT